MPDGAGIFLPFGIKDEWTQTLKRMTAATKDFTSELIKAQSSTKGQTKETGEAEKATIKWNTALGKLAGEGLKKINNFNARNLYRTFRDMPVLALAVGEGLREGAKSSMEFDRAMVDLRLSGSKSSEEIDEITASTLRLAEASGFTRTEVLQQATGLQKLGQSANESFKSVEGAAHYAKLMDVSLKEGVDAQTKVSQLYYDNVSHMGEAGDVLAYSVKHLRIPMDDFINAVERLGPGAKMSNTSLTDSIGLLKGLTEAGLPAERSAIALNRVMAMSTRVGLSFNAALEKIRQNYQRTLATKGSGAANAYLISETGIRQTGLIAPIFMKNAEAFKEYTNGAKEVANYTRLASAQMENTPAVKLQIALNDVKESFITLAAPIVGGLNLILSGFNALPSLVKTIAISFGILLAATYPVLKIWGHLQTLGVILKPLGSLIAKIFAPFFGAGSALGTVAAIVGKLSLFAGALYGIYKIIQLLKIAWDALSLHFEKTGFENLSANARMHLENRQHDGLIDKEGKLTAIGRTEFQRPGNSPTEARGGNTTSNGMVVHGDVHVHVGADKVLDGKKNSFVRALQAEIRASGK